MKMGRRLSIRLPGYDYASAGWYFVTICCKDRAHLFGEIREGEMVLNEVGRVVEGCWFETEAIRPNCRIHEYIIMPNHLHGIIEIIGSPNPDFTQSDMPKFASPSGTIGSIVRGFKIKSIMKIRELVCRGELQFAPTGLKIIELDCKIWQRNYYEHIIRNEESYQKIAAYIRNNPAQWQEDEYFR
jgi:putative transposase